jgi:nitrite reductase/ring-hydroxylating ferredoxin subunit
MTHVVRVCSVNELQQWDKVAIQTNGESVLVANVNGNIYAVSNICTREYAELVNGLVREDTISCPVHLSRFRLETGEVVNAPATPSLDASFLMPLSWLHCQIELSLMVCEVHRRC